MDKSLIINEIKLYLGIKTDIELAEFLGVSQPTISPVSYTHLDVYKRQACSCFIA